MSVQENLVEYFNNAIELEQKCDTLLTDSYLKAYSPKKLANYGLAVTNLVMTNMRTALGGKTVIELGLDAAFSKQDDEIQQGSLRVGDIVKLDRMASSASNSKPDANESSALEGVIVRFTSKSISVSVEEDTSDESLMGLYNNTGNTNIRMWIVKLTNSVTYKRMFQAMKKLGALNDQNKSAVLRILLGESRFIPRERTKVKTKFFDPTLNDSQKSAIEFAISMSPITIIHGPPGTGKTYTLIELIKQLTFNHKERVLVCGASNISVDNILERLSSVFSGDDSEADGDLAHKRSKKKKSSSKAGNPEKLVRIGHPARLLGSNLKHSLDVLSKTSYSGEGGDNQMILKDIENDIGSILGQIRKCKRYGERRALWAELKQLKRELRQRERKIVHDLLVNAQVVLSTLHGAGSNELIALYKDQEFSPENPLFDTIIIDEVSQSLEPQCWIPLATHLGCKRLVIAGDNKQLPATVKSKEEASVGGDKGAHIADLEFTLFDRLVADHDGNDYRKLLDVQYRMNTEIMKFPSEKLYEKKLKAADSVKDILLTDLPNVESTDETSIPCVWYDTQGGEFPEQTSEDDVKSALSASAGSKYNEMEALVVVQHVKKLIEAGVQPELIGVISPYSAQVSTLKRSLATEFDNKIEIATVDGFQGREKEVIVVSLVRSNDQREVGFLNESRRLNVAMTRPKRHLCIVGDLELMERCGLAFLKDWALFVDQHFEVRYPDLGDY